jgi:LysR family nitrogen assimilation transcriptional regulator
MAAKTVVGRPIIDPELTRVQAVVWSRNRPLAPAAEVVGKTIQQVVEDLAAQGKLPGRLLVG